MNNPSTHLLLGLALAGSFFVGQPAVAVVEANWPQFRGPGASGRAEGGAAPTTWDLTTGANVRWRVPVAGLAHASPIVWGDRIYVSTAVQPGAADLKVGLYGDIGSVPDAAPVEWRLLALERETGRTLWDTLAHTAVPRVQRHPKSTHCNSTPATDGERIAALFGSEGLFCFDVAGRLLWRKDLGPMNSGYFAVPSAQWGFAGSPVIHGGRAIVLCDVLEDSFVAAFELSSGREVWRTPRQDVPTWGTPTVVEGSGRSQIIVNGWHHSGGYDLVSGRELWRLDGGGDIPVPTPVVESDLGLVYLTSAHGRFRPMRAIRLDAAGDITPVELSQTNQAIAWVHPRQGNYMQTPIVVDRWLYGCTDAGVLTCFDARTGAIQYSERLGGGGAGFTASPVAVGGQLYFANELGTVYVVPAGPTFSVAATNHLSETCMATPALAPGTVLFRTRAHLVAIGAAAKPVEPGGASFKNRYLEYELGPDGRNRRFADRQTGQDYLAGAPGSYFAKVVKAGETHHASSVSRVGSRLEVEFGSAGAQATFKVETFDHYLTIKVLSVVGEGLEELVYGEVPLTLKGTPGETFAGCALALNLQTNVRELPGANARLGARCYPRFGWAGAKVALIGCPAEALRSVMQEVVRAAPDLPQSSLGGPWALEAQVNRGSYLFNFGDLSEQTVDDWIELARRLGMTQIDFHGGNSFRFGDCEPNRATYPEGRASLKRVIDRLHAAGIQAGLHTYAFFIDKKCPWVTPVPDPRLAKAATFTLAAALPAEADAVPVVESTRSVSAVTGFFVRNSVTLQIEDELIVFAEVAPEPPYGFRRCQRGAYGTRAAAHPAGAKVHHLKECFGLLVPDGDSSLLSEVAGRTAATFNECGFDMMYLDALDGEDILGGAANGWHYGSKFVFELWRQLERPALMEMSTFHHHLWYVRSRMGAWDHPRRSHKRFIDIHVAANEAGRGMFLPMHLGWWAVKTWTGPQGEPTFPDDIEYLCGKALGSDTGFSLMGVDPVSYGKSPALQRLGQITRRYEALRHGGQVPESVKAALRAPGVEFTLAETAEGSPVFRPIEYTKHKVEGSVSESHTWAVTNQFGEQPLQLRLEVLMSAEPYDSTNGAVVVAFDESAEFTEGTAAAGVSASLEPVTDRVKVGGVSGRWTAANTRAERQGTWAHREKRFSPVLDLGKQQALGVWVHGDGQGALLNVQLRCPEHVVAGIGEHYIRTDYKGWRYFELIEPEGDRYSEYTWPYGSPYEIYRESVDYRRIERVGLWLNHLPATGRATCHMSPIRALPLVRARLSNFRVTLGAQTLRFPVALESGAYLELRTPDAAQLYDAAGALVQEIQPEGQVPLLAAGVNTLQFACDREGSGTYYPRVRVTTIRVGPPLGGGTGSQE